MTPDKRSLARAVQDLVISGEISAEDTLTGKPLAEFLAKIADCIAKADEDSIKTIYAEDFLDNLVRLAPGEYTVAYRSLVNKFGQDLCKADWDRLIKAAKLRRVPPANRRPGIQINNRGISAVTREALAALHAVNDPPTLFVRSEEIVYVATDRCARPYIAIASRPYLRNCLGDAATFIKSGSQADLLVFPPAEIVDGCLAIKNEWQFPPLQVVTEVPTLRPDGTVISEAGYDGAARVVYVPAQGLKIEIPDDLNSDDVSAAVDLIRESVCDFHWVEEAGFANYLGFLLTPIVRPAITGCTPIALIDAPQAGTGKGLLADVASIMASGREAAKQPWPNHEEEISKTIGSTLMAGRQFICFDNVESVLKSPHLALALTATFYEARILGASENMLVPNLATWCATGNNIRPSGDLPRRCYHIRIDSRTSKPHQRKGLKHENLCQWVKDKRSDLVRSLLMLAVYWFRSGKPDALDGGAALGSFEDWHRTIAGILKCAGVDGFLANQTDFMESDETAAQWEVFLAELHAEYYGISFTSGMIGDRVRRAAPGTGIPAPFSLPESLSDYEGKGKVLDRVLGRSFAKRIGARFGDREYYIEKVVDATRQTAWRVRDRADDVVGKMDVAVRGIEPEPVRDGVAEWVPGDGDLKG
jgi:hypothetical protein